MLSETVQPYLLKRRCGVPTEHGIVATVARKFFVVLSHGLFLGLATIIAWPLLERASRTAIGRVGLPLRCCSRPSLALVVVALLLVTATAIGQVADRLHRVLDRFVGRWMGSWLERNALRFRRTDDALAALLPHSPAGLAPSVLLYMRRLDDPLARDAAGSCTCVGVRRPAQRGDGDRDDAHPGARAGRPRARRASACRTSATC